MTTETKTPWTRRIGGSWLAGSDDYPRLAKLGSTEAEALDLLAERRNWWLAMPVLERDQSVLDD